MWRQFKRNGIGLARCTVMWPMRQMGLEGALRGKPVKTTRSDILEEMGINPEELTTGQASFDWQAARDGVIGRMCTATLLNDVETY